jgi:hypothetical protein
LGGRTAEDERRPQTGLANFLDAPHAAIAGEHQSEIINLADGVPNASRRG